MNLQSSPFLDRILFSERQIILRPICSTFTISQKILGSGTTTDILRPLVLDPVRTILIRIPTFKVSFEDVCSSYSIYARCWLEKNFWTCHHLLQWYAFGSSGCSSISTWHCPNLFVTWPWVDFFTSSVHKTFHVLQHSSLEITQRDFQDFYDTLPWE